MITFPTSGKPLEVVPSGDRLVYLVTSETRRKAVPYRVDLLAHNGIGECSCKAWITRVWPLIRDGELTVADTFPTHPDKHIQACRNQLFAQTLAELAEEETDP